MFLGLFSNFVSTIKFHRVEQDNGHERKAEIIWSIVTLDDFKTVLQHMGTAVAQWLRCCATNRKVGCSIPAGVIGIFH